MHLLLVLIMLSSGVMANTTYYVGDNVTIPMRTEALIAKDNIIQRLDINTPVKLIKDNKNGWSEIEYQNNNGWMVSNYLSNQPINDPELPKFKNQLSLANKNIQKQSAKIENLSEKNSNLKKHIDGIQQKLLAYQSQVLDSDKLEKKVTALSNSNTNLLGQLNQLKTDNKSLHSTNFLTIISGLTLIFGLSIGYLISRANYKQNDMYRL